MTEQELTKIMKNALEIVGATDSDFIKAAMEGVDIINDVGTPEEILTLYINWLREAN